MFLAISYYSCYFMKSLYFQEFFSIPNRMNVPDWHFTYRSLFLRIFCRLRRHEDVKRGNTIMSRKGLGSVRKKYLYKKRKLLRGKSLGLAGACVLRVFRDNLWEEVSRKSSILKVTTCSCMEIIVCLIRSGHGVQLKHVSSCLTYSPEKEIQCVRVFTLIFNKFCSQYRR